MFAALPLPRLQARLRMRGAPAAVLLGVLALHAVLLVLLTQLGVWRNRGEATASPPPLMMWLPDPVPQRAVSPIAVAAATPARREARSTTALPAAPAPDPTQTITQPAPQTSAPAAAQRPPEAESPDSAAPAALNLDLPRAASASWRQRSAALDDTRSNTRTPVNLATLIDKALGGDPAGPIIEERLADGSVRFRRGGQCVVARPNQAQNIDPYNGSVMPKPRLLDRC